MAKDKEERAAKKAEKAEKLRQKLAGNAQTDKKVEIKFNPVSNKTPVYSEPPHSTKKPILNTNPKAYQSAMTWCATVSADIIDYWNWKEPRAWNDIEWENDIAGKLNSFESLKWSELISQRTGGKKKRRKLHHEQEVSSLCKEAQDRWLELGLEEYETAFRFRLGGTKRIWGYRLGAHFHLVWYERHHKIYPVDK